MALSNTINLSKNQQEIYNLFVNQKLPVSVIAKSRQITVQAVYKTLKKISVVKELPTGGLNLARQSYFKPPVPKTFTTVKTPYWRLHGLEFNAKILYKGQFYDKRRFEKGDLYYLDGNTIRLYSNSIEIYQNKERFFMGKSIETVNRQAESYFTALFHKIERSLGIMIVKGENTAITMSKTGDYAEVNNELAQDYNEKKLKIGIKANDDGKIWFVIDHSFNLNEAEFKHPKTSKQDSERLSEVFNQYRDNKDLLTPIELQKLIGIILTTNKDISESQFNSVQQMTRLTVIVEGIAKKLEQIL